MFKTDTKKLFNEVTRSYNQLKSAKNSEEKMALANYIGNLYVDIASVQEDDVYISKKTIFGSRKNYQKFMKKIDIYEIKMLENYVLQKDFHRDYLKKVLNGMKSKIKCIDRDEICKTSILSIDEYYSIFYDFMKSIGQDEMFDKFYKEGRIYACDTDENMGILGQTEVNPISKEINIFVGDPKYDINSMYVLAHEFGHAYDFSRFDEPIELFNRFFYQSFYSEVFSKLFERLFLQYLIKNNILIDEAKDKLLEMEETNCDYMLGAYILSLLDDGYLLSNSYQFLSKEKLYELVGNNFSIEDNIKKFIHNCTYFDITEDYRYAYGDIMSMFLKIQIDNYGFDNDLIDEIFKIRSSMFDSEIFEKLNFGPNRYKKLHRQEINLLKK